MILLLQGILPLNPQEIKGMSFPQALNTAVSFITNTNL
ncbi:potassium-transporting ATPase A subunit [Francisella tularensis subsp. tularensis str. SCHU S4 substr. NR-28534]|nr:potassium-transporting ATPase A subunit [Francisella tularensis subsp. tularensis str. SCHU S4 substr. NR-28534]